MRPNLLFKASNPSPSKPPPPKASHRRLILILVGESGRRRRRMVSGSSRRRMINRQLAPDVETEILLLLPVKTLKRFLCVSKSWYSLISSPQFLNAHFLRAQQRPPLLLTIRHESPDSTFDRRLASFNRTADSRSALDDNPSFYKSFDPFTIGLSSYTDVGTLVKKLTKTLPQPVSSTSIIGKPFMQSCRGLVLISSWGCPLILLCNPTTEEIVSLPPTRQTNLCVGLGYIPSSHQIKVVRFFYGGTGIRDSCEIFTLGSGQWREGKTPPFDVYRGCTPFLHGALHFLPRFNRRVQADDYIAAFDIETEDYRRGIPLPEYYYHLGEEFGIACPSDCTRLTKLGGSLCLTLDFGKTAGRLEMWILKDCQSVEWVRWHTIDITPVCSHERYTSWAYPVVVMGDGSILISLSYREGIMLLSCDPQGKIVTIKGNEELAAAFYVESLYTVHE